MPRPLAAPIYAGQTRPIPQPPVPRHESAAMLRYCWRARIPTTETPAHCSHASMPTTRQYCWHERTPRTPAESRRCWTSVKEPVNPLASQRYSWNERTPMNPWVSHRRHPSVRMPVTRLTSPPHRPNAGTPQGPCASHRYPPNETTLPNPRTVRQRSPSVRIAVHCPPFRSHPLHWSMPRDVFRLRRYYERPPPGWTTLRCGCCRWWSRERHCPPTPHLECRW